MKEGGRSLRLAFRGSKVVGTPYDGSSAYHVYYLYAVELENRDRLRQKLPKAGVDTGVYYRVPVR
ncbi:hypothetical protein B9Q04_04925 [Candidatus Marsarchaeota G2 archaeon BE_D]|uniref:Uncharacterized protein n=1 Tax=Candidatus Marsarchaeota G2 archaeon BE_D TaxID=1978158 RepID=A0A2R6CCF2_9ARCH|nr:MAG: hypothetical protein B9Q04_04925 [Candidatus Marsarchaeota G2 archaeon BE_D]